MDWLSQNKAVIVCHEKVVEIPLIGGEKICQDYPQVEFRVDLISGATPVAKSPYRLAPSEIQELPEQLQELQDKVVDEKKWRVKLRRVRAMSMTIQSSVKDKIFYFKRVQGEKSPGDMLRDLDQQMEKRADDDCVRAMAMIIQYGVRGMILAAQSEAFKQENGMPQQAFSPQQQALLSGTVQGSTPANGQATLLPQAFNTMTLRDPTDANWNMDTGASSHLNSNATNLSTLFNSCMYPSVLVGDGKSIPVTNTGHSTLPTPYRPLHLNNVLITPNIVKNLISVRQFVRDNKCTIEFDEFGFSVKDYWTRQILLRCDSTGDLYPVTSLSYPQAFLVGQQTWHQRLGHPGSEVLRHLVSNNLISCNKTKSTVLCHACQLGKHVRLPFSLSETVVKSPFDIIHSDLWTSPLSSVSGIKYYVLFLDHFSHYLWVYPLRNKSDALSKFIHFRAFVKNQFQCDIKSLQCDHGGEFDNNALHQLFATNGITIRFSCPKTSQQNGKSERMIRTINNLIRTLLFQAHLPPTFWVEALHMAAHLLNILPSTAINNEIPHTRLYKTTPNYADLRVFGCLCYPHVHTNHKLEPRATPSIFLGYPTNHRGYRCLDLNTDKIILSRHVTFDETVFPYGSMTPDASPPYNFLDTDPNLIQKHMLHNMPTVGSSPVAATRQPTSPSSQPTSTFAYSTGPPTNQPTNHSTLQPTPFAPTNQTPTTNLPPKNSIPPTPPPVPSPATTQPNRNPTSTHSMVTHYRVGISMTRNTSGMFLSQQKYASEQFERASMLTYIIVVLQLTRILSFLVMVCLYMHDPREPHFSALKRILRYIRDWAGCPTTRQSTSSYCVFLGNNLLSWYSKRQVTLSHSSVEAEYRGVANAIAETCWLRNILRELHTPLSTATLVYCNNAGLRRKFQENSKSERGISKLKCWDLARKVIEGRAHSSDLAILTRQAQLSLGRIGQTLRFALIVEVVLADGTLLLAEIVLEAEIASAASKKHMVIHAPPTGHGPDIDITLVTRTAPVA
ncbi:ribonuclease H-like domain-containing protein [Tanacetum coccineum]